jgi:endonuclease G
VDEDGKTIDQHLNEGIRISSIYDDLANRSATSSPPKYALLQEALGYATLQSRQKGDGPTLSEPGGGSEARVLAATRPIQISTFPETRDPGEISMAQDRFGSLTLTVPLEISVRLRDPGANAGSAVPAAAGVGGPAVDRDISPAARVAPLSASLANVLRHGAEVVEVDPDYSNRTGYDPGFVSGVNLSMPRLKADAPYKALTFGEGGRQTALKYTHYSVVLKATNKMALFTATNLDGDKFRKVDRTTGRVAEAAEGDKWFIDPRVPAAALLEQDFYTAWSTYFDRGHLTRREDTNWGDSDDESERGNADTFHFTNSTPQHFRFNESTKYWQGVERMCSKTAR